MDRFRKSFDWVGAVVNNATNLFSEFPLASNDFINPVYELIKNALDVSIYDSEDKKKKCSELLEDAFDYVMEDSDMYQLINKMSKTSGASNEIIFLRLLKEERNV